MVLVSDTGLLLGSGQNPENVNGTDSRPQPYPSEVPKLASRRGAFIGDVVVATLDLAGDAGRNRAARACQSDSPDLPLAVSLAKSRGANQAGRPKGAIIRVASSRGGSVVIVK